MRTVQRNGTTYQQNTANIGSVSKPDQEVSAPEAKEIGGNAPISEAEVSTKPDSEPVDPEAAKVRRELAKLTREAGTGSRIKLQICSLIVRSSRRLKPLTC